MTAHSPWISPAAMDCHHTLAKLAPTLTIALELQNYSTLLLGLGFFELGKTCSRYLGRVLRMLAVLHGLANGSEMKLLLVLTMK